MGFAAGGAAPEETPAQRLARHVGAGARREAGSGASAAAARVLARADAEDASPLLPGRLAGAGGTPRDGWLQSQVPLTIISRLL